MRVTTRSTSAALAVAAAGTLLAGLPALAAPSVSHLVVSDPPGTSVQIDMATDTTADIAVKLDDNCPNAYGNGQEYGIAAVSAMPGVATVSPASVPGLHCGAAAQSFTFTGLTNGTTTVRFDAVAKNTGLQRKLRGVDVTVTVINAPTDDPGNPPPAHERPAAPAVSNAYLDDNNLVAACKTAYADAGHHWRGALIRTVAHWSAANKLSKSKDDVTKYPTDNDWILFVQAKVNALCGYTPV